MATARDILRKQYIGLTTIYENKVINAMQEYALLKVNENMGLRTVQQPFLLPRTSFADYCNNPYHLPDDAWNDICAQADAFAARVSVAHPSTELLPFDLQKALAGEPVVTRDGRKVEDLKYFLTAKVDYPVYGVIDGSIHKWTSTGQWRDGNGKEDTDLFMQPRFVTKWVNIFRYDSKPDDHFVGQLKLHESKEIAQEAAGGGAIATVPIIIPLK